jgi:5S rRNA maturation endonuclease (ribonuclease M5)
MKKSFHILLAAVLTLLSINAKSQDNLNKSLASIKEKIQDVQIDKTTYKQSVEILDASKGKLSFSYSEVDEKGKATNEKFEFYVSDIDRNTIVRKTSGKKLFVSLSINNNQKFIKHFKDDKLDSYTNEVQIYLSGADAAQELADLFKTTIPLVNGTEKEWKTNADALNWLKANITNVTSGPTTFEQSFSFGGRKDYTASFNRKKTDQKNVTTDETYDFSLPDINTKKLSIKVSGGQLSVSIETKGSDPYIKYSKNKDQQSFVNNLEIFTEDVDQARNIVAAFTTAIEKSKLAVPDFATIQKSLDFIVSNTTDLTAEKKTLGQKISFTPGNGTKSVFIFTQPDSKGKSIEERYEFYLSDLDANSVAFKVNKDKIAVVCNSKSKTKFIKYLKDNTLQNFTDEISILTSDIETSRELTEAFKAAIKNSVAQPPVFLKTVNETISFLTGALTGETVGTDVYKLNFSSISTEPLNVKYVVGKTDSKGVTDEMSYEFYPYLLDPASVKVSASGKYLSVQVTVKGKDSYVKVFKKEAQQAFDNGIEFMAFDARQAQDIAEAIKYISGSSKPKDKVWADKQAALKFVTENTGEIKNEGNTIKQNIALTNNDPCKISLNVTRTDDKGKATEELYEFALSDMNKALTTIKVSGKNIEVSLACKNKEKLVKVYKNGEQQAWGTEVKLLTNDVETARNMAEALKSAITLCEK